jgi:hypothetical protein
MPEVICEVTCPCCHGKKRLSVTEYIEEEGRTVLLLPVCQHCQGKGTVTSDVSEVVVDVETHPG